MRGPQWPKRLDGVRSGAWPARARPTLHHEAGAPVEVLAGGVDRPGRPVECAEQVGVGRFRSSLGPVGEPNT